jgi:hypothetical protein
MKRHAYVGRALAAILLTGIVSSLIVAAEFAVAGLAQFSSSNRTFAGIMEFVSAVWFVGSFIALPCALIVGLCVEWPKSYWLLKRPSRGWWLSLSISLLAAAVLLHSWFWIGILRRGSIGPDLADGLVFFTCAAAVGGACSAAFWWWLVVRPGRTVCASTQRHDERLTS